MEELQKHLIETALRRHEKIYPCHQRDLGECFTRFGNKVLFWFNTEDRSTHVLEAEIC